MTTDQPDPAPVARQEGSKITYRRLTVRYGKSASAKEWPGRAPAATTVAIRRYNCGMTVGSGWYHKYSHTDPIGSACYVLGWFSDGRVNVDLPGGGCGVIGRADLDVLSWPLYVPEADRAAFDALPRRSLVVDGELTSPAGGRDSIVDDGRDANPAPQIQSKG